MNAPYLHNVDFPINNDPVWGLFEYFYDKYYLAYNGDRTSVIPRKIHHVWLGGKFPDKYKRLRDTWINLHPTWEYKCWGDDDAEAFDMVNRKAFDIVNNVGAKSDIFRYEILSKHGGLYIDTDFECLKAFDDLLYLDFIGGSGWTEYPSVFNGLIACKPNNAFIKSVMDGIGGQEINSTHGIGEILPLTGAEFITPLFIDYLENTDDKVVMFPKNYFYPLPNTFRLEIREDNEKNRKRIYSFVKPNSYCIHLWYTSWQ